MISESTSWANIDGTPVEFVKGKTKMVKATLAHAKKLGLLPRVTSINSVIANHGLDIYKQEQVAKAIIELGLPESGDMDREWKAKVSEQAGLHAAEAAEAGRIIHAEVERWLEGYDLKTHTSTYTVTGKAAEAAVKVLAQLIVAKGVEIIATEESFASVKLGYAGTPDIKLYWKKEHGDPMVDIIDLKTTKLGSFRKPYESWLLQLGAYSLAHEESAQAVCAPRFIQLIVDRDTGEIWKDKPHCYTELECRQAERAFKHVYEIWCWIKGYDPRMFWSEYGREIPDKVLLPS